MIRTHLVSLALLLCAGLVSADAARATGTMTCSALDGSIANVEMNVSTTIVEQPLWLRIQIDEEFWSTMAEDDGIPIAIAQSYSDAGSLLVDVVDQNAENIVAAIRIMRTEEDDARYQIGFLQLFGRGVYPISCEGP